MIVLLLWRTFLPLVVFSGLALFVKASADDVMKSKTGVRE
jgi:hypothetical protein